MTTLERLENLVLGSGEAGKYLAWTLAKGGQRSAVIERGLIGGSCPNIACLPSKNIIHSAQVAALCRRGAEFGISNRFGKRRHERRAPPQATDGRRPNREFIAPDIKRAVRSWSLAKGVSLHERPSKCGCRMAAPGCSPESASF